jgi:hypothetical protein
MGVNYLIVVGVLKSWEDAEEMQDIITTSTVAHRFRNLIKRK